VAGFSAVAPAVGPLVTSWENGASVLLEGPKVGKDADEGVIG